MKPLQIILLSLLLSTQSFAWGQAEQKALLGFTAGVVLTHFISNYDDNTYRTQTNVQRVYTPEPLREEYIDARNRDQTVVVNNYYNNRTYYNKYPRHEHRHMHHRHRHSHKVIVENNYRNNYYY